jgi:hypothetical protein
MNKKYPLSLVLSVLMVLQLLLPVTTVFASELPAPTNLTATKYTPSDVLLKWDSVSGVYEYKVYKLVGDQKQYVGLASTNQRAVPNLTEGSHSFAVTAVKSTSESTLSNTVTVDIVYPEMQPPATVTHQILKGNDIYLKWEAAQYAKTYNVYQLVNGEKKLLATTENLNRYLPNMPEGSYSFAITSIHPLYGESQLSNALSFELVYPVMQPPATLTNFILKGNDIFLKWDEALYASGYKVYRIMDGNAELIATTDKDRLNQYFSNLPEGNYTYAVASFSDRFGESAKSTPLSIDLVHPEMQPPANLKSYILKGNDIFLRWDEASFATGYKVYQVVNGEKTLIATTDRTNQYSVNMPEGDYAYEVASYSDRFGESTATSAIALTLVHPEMQAPESVNALLRNGNDLILTWKESAFATGYNVYQIVDGQRKLFGSTDRTSLYKVNMPEGDYTFEVTSVSDRFGESSKGNRVSISIVFPEMQSPSIQLKMLSANSAAISWKAVTYAMTYNVYEIVDGSPVLLKTTDKTSHSLQGMSDGVHEYVVTAVSDRFGESTPSNKVTAEVGLGAPSPVEATVLGSYITVKWGAVSGAASYNVYQVINGELTLLTNTTLLTTTLENAKPGIYEFLVYAVSSTGTQGARYGTATAEIKDSTPPVTTSNVAEGWLNNSFMVQLTATDDVSGVDKTYYSIDGGSYVEGTSFTISEEGVHQVLFYSVDKAGNVEQATTVEVKVDKTPPVTTSNVADGWSKEDVSVELSAIDNLSGVDKTYYSIDGSEYTEGTSFIISEEGIHQVSFYSVDIAGNIEQAITLEVKVDKTAPTASWELVDEYVLGTELMADYLAEDATSGVAVEQLTVNGTVVAKGETVTLDQPGEYQFTLVVTDAAGWTTTLEKTIVVYIPATIEVLPKVIKGNKGEFTVKVTLPDGFTTTPLDLSSVKLNGVSALSGTRGLDQMAKNGQFKFNRADFPWTEGEMIIELRGYIDGKLVVGRTTVKVLK